MNKTLAALGLAFVLSVGGSSAEQPYYISSDRLRSLENPNDAAKVTALQALGYCSSVGKALPTMSMLRYAVDVIEITPDSVIWVKNDNTDESVTTDFALARVDQLGTVVFSNASDEDTGSVLCIESAQLSPNPIEPGIRGYGEA
jgi:hypothetical protein